MSWVDLSNCSVRRVTLKETLKKSMASHVQASQPAHTALLLAKAILAMVVRTGEQQSPLGPSDCGQDLEEGSSALPLLPVWDEGGEEARGHGGWKRKRGRRFPKSF